MKIDILFNFSEPDDEISKKVSFIDYEILYLDSPHLEGVI